MQTEPFNKQIVLWGDSRITTNITKAEAFHTWAENEDISHRFYVVMDTLWLTVYPISTAQVEACNDWLRTNHNSCCTA